MVFDSDIKHWPNLEAFVAYLQTTPRPSWVKGLCHHNTYIPNETQWRGLASLQSMRATYIGKGWSAGPHLYLAAEAPSPADTGIWQMTPLTNVGVHAGTCNSDHLGIENVGDFQARPPSAAQYQLLLAVTRAILIHWMLTPDHVQVHNECMPGRTCPGRYLDPNALRADLSRPRPPPASSLGRYRFRVPQAAFTARDPNARLADGPALFQAGETVEIGDITAGWAWIKTGIGFVPLATLELV